MTNTYLNMRNDSLISRLINARSMAEERMCTVDVNAINEAIAELRGDRKFRLLRKGELMCIYMDFDRKADKTWTSTEYLLLFGSAVSAATVATNQDCSIS